MYQHAYGKDVSYKKYERQFINRRVINSAIHQFNRI